MGEGGGGGMGEEWGGGEIESNSGEEAKSKIKIFTNWTCSTVIGHGAWWVFSDLLVWKVGI